MSGELRGPADALLDEGLAGMSARGIGGVAGWRARVKDDDGRVWRAAGDAVDALRWRGPGAVAALRSLRPLSLEVRAEGDGAASRTVVRRLVADGVVVRRWREKGLAATLFRPAGAPSATVLVAEGTPAAADGTAAAGAPDGASAGAPATVGVPAGAPLAQGEDAALACALLASRGVLVVHATAGAERAVELLAAVPGATDPRRLDALPLPPGVPAVTQGDAVAWDALLADLGAAPRT